MSVIAELRKTIISALSADATVTGLVGTRFYDRAAADAAFPYVTFGYAQTVTADYDCFQGYEVSQQIDVWSRQQGRSLEAERITQGIMKALHGASLTLADPYGLSTLRVTNFDVRDDPDGITAHGILTIEATVEEA